MCHEGLGLSGWSFVLTCLSSLKAAELQMLKKNEKNKQTKTVNTGQVMFIGKIYYY